MKVLIAGPDLAPPWTEGRKNFVRDLAPRLAERMLVRIITTGSRSEAVREPCEGQCVAAASKWQRLTALHQGLREAIARWHPDAVCHFPYGTFHGIRGVINRWSMRHIDACCAREGIRCLTILYSMTAGSPERLRRGVSELVLGSNSTDSGPTLTLGIDVERAARVRPAGPSRPTVLFLAGIAEARRGALQYVLAERGLGDLVDAAPSLAATGIGLIVAIPLLRDVKFRASIELCFRTPAPGLHLDCRDTVSVPDIFAEADLFVFPYRVELQQFTPTSILESMAANVPVVVSNLAMLAPLATGGQTAYIYPSGDGKRLAEIITAAIGDAPGRAAHAAAAKAMVTQKWKIERSVEELVALLHHQVPGSSGRR